MKEQHTERQRPSISSSVGFTKGGWGPVSGNKEQNTNRKHCKSTVSFEMNSLIQFLCQQGRGKNTKESLEHFRLLILFDKHFKK